MKKRAFLDAMAAQRNEGQKSCVLRLTKVSKWNGARGFWMMQITSGFESRAPFGSKQTKGRALRAAAKEMPQAIEDMGMQQGKGLRNE